VLGSPLDRALIVAVLTLAAASTQATKLSTARTSLSMTAKGAVEVLAGLGEPGRGRRGGGRRPPSRYSPSPSANRPA
jgi:hypothetical protein